MNDFLQAYIAAALWAAVDDQGEPLDNNYTKQHLAPETLAKMEADCRLFYDKHHEKIGEREEEAGHDFWLTRQGCGAGFWDGDWAELGRYLTDASKAFPEVDLYVGDDGLIHC